MTTTSKDLPPITQQDTIEDLFTRYPHKAQKLAYELTRWGLQCVGCSAATWETIEAGMMKHGKKSEHVQKLVENLNAILAEKSDPETISLTERAAERFISIREAEGAPNAALRFDERAAGCSGFEYSLDFAEEQELDDVVFTSHGVDIYVNKHSLPRLIGSEIDYIDGLQSGFRITNPNVRSSCGCGSSHGYN